MFDLRTPSDKDKGFTLVELAIALMVIGLLIGGVLKGQELIKNAQVTRMARYFNDVESAVAIFQSIYNQLPGDMRYPATFLPNCEIEGLTGCARSGNNNGRIENTGDEIRNFWIHLNRAGLLASPIHEDISGNACLGPENPFGGRDTMFYRDIPGSRQGNMLGIADDVVSASAQCSYQNMRIKNTKMLDEKLDDGKPLSGNILNHPVNRRCHDTANEELYRSDFPTTSCEPFWFLNIM